MKSIALLSCILALVATAGCIKKNTADTRTSSAYPVAVDRSKVGRYHALVKSGGGYFYDEVLEYRVWVHPRAGGDDHYQAFPDYEDALAFSASTDGAEPPLALVRQREWIDEPEKGHFIVKKGERITEWRVEWLKDHQRQPDSIMQFVKQRSVQK